MSETTNVTKQFLDKDGLDALWNKICSVFASKDELEDLGNSISLIDEKVKNEAIIDTTNPYFLLGQSAQNTTSKAGTDANCYIKEGFIYSNSTKVLTEANLEDPEPVQRNDNTWSNVKLDTDGFMGVDVPTIPTSLKNPHSLTIQGNGTTIDSYDGSVAKTVNITPDNIDAAPAEHEHSISEITDFPDSLKNPYSLTIQGNGTTLTNGVYNGSASKIVNITPASIGAASVDDIPTIPEALKNPNALTIQANGTTIDSYDGSTAKTVNITAASLGLSIVFDYKGVTTSKLSDGSTTKPIVINNSNYTQKPGDVVIVNGDTDKEYFWNGTIWEEIGRTIDLSGYALVSHTHSKSEITDFPNSLKNPYSLTIQGNGTTLTNGFYDGSAAKTVNITPASIGAASADDVEGSLYKTIYAGAKETSNPGILVKTSVGATSNAMISVKITGNAYCVNGGTKPIFTVLEFYNYYNGGSSNPRIINISGTHFGADIGTIKLFNYDSKVYLWIPQTGNYQSFNVFANWTNSSGVDNNVNIVESLTKGNVPSTATYLVEFTPNIVAYDGDTTSSNSGHTHTVNATSSTTEVAAKTHSHTVTATGNVSSSFSGTQTTTSNNTSGATVASSGHTHDISGRVSVSGQRDSTNKGMFNVTFSFSGSSSATTSTTEVAAKTHSHNVTATGNVSSSFSGTQTTTSNNTSGATVASSGHTHTTSNDGSHSHTI